MGDRYFLTVKCPVCGHQDQDVYYAPTCGFVDWTCKCGHVVDLEELTGISYEDASNLDEMRRLGMGIELKDIEMPKMSNARELLRNLGYQDVDTNIVFSWLEWQVIDDAIEELEDLIRNYN